jgi:hypothetical protein
MGRGRHAARRERRRGLRIWHLPLLTAGVLAALAAGEVIGVIIAAACAAFLVCAFFLAAATWVPPRVLLLAGLLLSWPVTEWLRTAGFLPHGMLSALVSGTVTSGAFATALLAQRAGQRRTWQASRGRA